MKASYEHVTGLVRSLAPTWQSRMGLDHYDIEHLFLDSFYDDVEGDDIKVTAVTEVRWNYLLAKIKWYLPSCTRHDDATLERVVVHELVHVLLSPEQSLLDLKLDELTSDLTADRWAAVQQMYYERMELATEVTTRVILAAYS